MSDFNGEVDRLALPVPTEPMSTLNSEVPAYAELTSPVVVMQTSLLGGLMSPPQSSTTFRTDVQLSASVTFC